MGYFLFAGIFLKIDNIEIKTSTEVVGCPTCKTFDQNKFCNKCGSEVVTYDKPSKIDNVGSLLSKTLEDDDLDALYDTFMFSYDCVVPNETCDFGELYDLDDEFDCEFTHHSMVTAGEFYKPITDVLDQYNIKYKLINGITYFLL